MNKKKNGSLDSSASEKLFWSDISARLNSMEDLFGGNSDFVVLSMSIEMGTLAKVRDFYAIVHGVPLKITPKDGDRELKMKVLQFTKDLEQIKITQLEKRVIPGLRQRIDQLEKEVAGLKKLLIKQDYNKNDKWLKKLKRKIFN
jgi:hypothetical protein